MSAADAPPDPPSQPPTSSHDSNSVNLRVTYLHAGNPRPPHELGQVPVETTIGALKSRLQTELLETPRPQEQRLIYQGRPLLQDAMTLQEALRLNGPVGPLPYTIHIIIQPRQAASHFRPDTSASVHTSPGVERPRPGPGALMPGGLTQPPFNQDQLHESAVRMQAVAQAHLNTLQQQLHTLQQQQGQIPWQRFSATVQINGQPVHTAPAPPNTSGQPGSVPAPGEPANQQHHPHGVAAIPHPVPQGVPGPLHNGLLNPGQQIGNLPFQRPLSVPPPARPGVPHTNFQIPPPPQMIPPMPGYLGYPMLHPIPRLAPPQPTETTVWLAASRHGPEALLFAPGHGYFSSGARTGLASTTQIRQHAQNLSGVRAVATPASNQNDRFATRADTRAQPDAQQPAGGPVAGPLALQNPLQPGQPVGPQARPRALNDDFMGLVIQRGWLFLRLYMFMFVLSEPGTWRRYLLLGLALIVCLLPRQNPLNHIMGAARRHIDNLIGPPAPAPARRPAATGTQPQPAQTPAPPANGTRPPAARGAINLTPEQAATRVMNNRAEHDQRQREANLNPNPNPNMLRDIFYRVEQAIALFLASLIPGVGERHVAAREEQRRERLRVEMERVNAEREAAEEEQRRRTAQAAAGEGEGTQTQQQQVGGQAEGQQAKADGVADGEPGAANAAMADAASSTGVEASQGGSGLDETQQVRERAAAVASTGESAT